MNRLNEAYTKVLSEGVDYDKVERSLAKELDEFNQALPAAQEFLKSKGYSEVKDSGGRTYVKSGRTISLKIVLMNSKAGAGLSAASEVVLNENALDLLKCVKLFHYVADEAPAEGTPNVTPASAGVSNVQEALFRGIGFLNDLSEDADAIEFE